MRLQRIGAVLLPLLLLSGCNGRGDAPSAEKGGEELTMEALFQTESGEVLCGSAAWFSTEERSGCCQVDGSGTASISGLPRDGELLLTLCGRQQEVQGSMTLSLGRGAVTDATTGEDGVGHVTVREDADDVALLFVLTEDGTLQCALWLAEAAPSGGEVSRKGA